MDGIVDRGANAARCERCDALVVEQALCPACMLRDGFLDEEPAPAQGEPAQARLKLQARAPNHGLEDAPLVEGYELLAEIGRGGMGIVYLAEQMRPLRRRVALKVIKLGMDTKQVTARFEAERQALALMDHPSVAKVFGAGTSSSGRPYFVMEMVHGPRIIEYCDQFHLSTRERLELFLQVCRAIQHAHQKGIIHRDIKPSNILVAQQDGAAVPKVIDFGIAKAIGGQWLTDETIFTCAEQFLGTPAYTSPEQAEGGGDIDTRTDIYALGVLLYELLTGQTPFDSHDLLRSGWDSMRRTIRETEPQRPSTRLTTLAPGELSRIANRRRTDAPKLIHAIRGDLDWIIMKCLEKERGRRYENCSAIADEIQRHLHHEPVAARPPSHLYRLQKLARRNKLKLSIGALVAVAMLGAVTAAAWSFFKWKEAQAAQEFFKGTQILRTILPTNRPVDIFSLPPTPPDITAPKPATTLKEHSAAFKMPAGLFYSSNRPAPQSLGKTESLLEAGQTSPTAPLTTDIDPSKEVSTQSPVVSPATSGTTYGQLAAAWWHWLMELPLTNSAGVTHPNLDTPFFSVSEGQGQNAEVWFLASPFGMVRRSCVIPPDKWIFLGLLNVESSSLEGGSPFFGLTRDDQAAAATWLADHIVGLFCEIDGVPVADLASYRILSPQITFTAPTPWTYGYTGGRGTSTGDGYFLLIKPLGPGPHTIHYGGAFQFRKPADPFDDYFGMENIYFIAVP